MGDNGNGKKRPLTRAEKFKNYCIGLGALTALILGVWANLRGEPEAAKTWKTAQKLIQQNRDKLNKLSRRVVYLQAHEEGRTAASIQVKLDALQKKYDALGGGSGGLKPKIVQVSRPVSVRACRAGYVTGSDGRCRPVPRAVAKKVASDKKDADAVKAALVAEKRKRAELERRKKELLRRLYQQKKAPPAPKPLPKVPAKLDDAAK
jgi:hypothetical protein